jgi:uncharacterized protein YfaS (alpha-2-macroglobulin family)
VVAAVCCAAVVAGGLGGLSWARANPPRIVGFQPAATQDVSLAEGLRIDFDQPMQRDATERAFQIAPELGGKFDWDGNSLRFRPSAPPPPETTYTVELAIGARSLLQQPLARPFRATFRTAAKFALAYSSPAAGATEVETDDLIAIQFSRPVVPLTALAEPARQSPVAIEPAVSGAGEWLNTSTYLLRPAGGLAPSTEYKVRVPAELKNLDNQTLESAYEYTFTTVTPAVKQVTPENNARFVAPQPEITVAFNQPVEREGAQRSFHLTAAGGGEVAGAFTWTDDATMVFRPDARLRAEVAYGAVVNRGVRAARATAESKDDFRWSFTAAGDPRVLSTQPTNGATGFERTNAVTIMFNQPMDMRSITDALEILPQPSSVFSRTIAGDTQLQLNLDLEPSTAYTITIAAGVKDRFGQPIPSAYLLRFTTAPLRPSATFPDSGLVGAYSAYGTPRVVVDASNVRRVDFALYSLEDATFLDLARGAISQPGAYTPSDRNLLRRWSTEAAANLNETRRLNVEVRPESGPLAPGLYFLKASAPESTTTNARVMLVTRTNLALKRSQDEVLVWAADLASGQVTSGLRVEVKALPSSPQASVVTTATGTTDSDGVFRAPAGSNDRLYVLARGGDDLAVASTDWADGLRAFDFGFPSEPSPSPVVAAVYTDRPVYRPGDTVYFQGTLRQDSDASYSLPPPDDRFTLSIADSRNRAVFTDTAKLTDYGTFNDQFKIGEGADLGFYRLSVGQGTRQVGGASFNVAEFRKPEFLVEVQPDKPRYVAGDDVNAVAQANLFLGAPLAGAKVHWRALRATYVFNPTVPGLVGTYAYTDFDPETDTGAAPSNLLGEGVGTTDADGRFPIGFKPDLSKFASSQRLTLEASVTDQNNQEVSGRQEVVLHKGELYVGLRPERYAGSAGQAQTVNLITVDLEGKRLPNIEVALEFAERRWFSVQRQLPGGGFAWTSRFEDTVIGNQTVRTGADGTATATFMPPKAGLYHVAARAQDGRGNAIRSGTSLYISGSEFVNWRQDNNDRIALIADKPAYKAGEVAKILIPSPYARATGLLTVERGKILSQRLLPQVGNSDTIEVPVGDNLLPNAYVSVLLLKPQSATEPAEFKLGYVELKVDDAPRRLSVAVTPDKAQYAPREVAKFTVKVTDAGGKPVAAEVAVALVDLSALSLGEAGRPLPDVFYRRRGLGVVTADSLVRSVDKLAAAAPAGGKGGSGGGGDLDTVRANFQDLAYWEADLRTNANGEIGFEAKLPDNLTTWRLTARALTVDTRVGEQTADLKVTKDLLLRPALPRFLVAGDQARVETIVNNRTGSDRDVQVTLAANGLEGDLTARQVKVPANGTARAGWDLKATGAEAKLTFRAAGGGLGDALELALPILPATTPESVATLGQIEDRAVEVIRPPLGAGKDQGELRVQVDPSLAAGLQPGLTYLRNYPYDSTDAATGKLLANVTTLRALQKLGAGDPDLEQKLTQQIGPAIQRLNGGQRPDGGWSWWPGGESDPFLTAYAVLALGRGDDAGYAVENAVLNRARDYLARWLSAPVDAQIGSNANLRAFVLYALGEAKRPDLARLNNLHDQQRSRLGTYGKALLALGIARANGSGDDRLKPLLSDLTSAALVSSTGAHWEEAAPDYRTLNTNNRSTAIVLETLVTLDPQNALIPQAVRWLMVTRQDGHWETNQETAWAVLALSDYLYSVPGQAGPSAFRVQLNGKAIGQSAGGSAAPADLRVALRDLALGADNALELDRTRGSGPLFYAAALRYFLPGSGAQSASHGVGVGRRYLALDARDDTGLASAPAGQTLRVKLTIVAPQDLHYVVIEDPLPAGAEAVDLSLKTTSAAAREAAAANMPRQAWRFNHTDLRDDRAVVFATFLPKGTYEYTYLVRLTTPGTYQLRPPTARETYFPEVWGRGDGGTFRIE